MIPCPIFEINPENAEAISIFTSYWWSRSAESWKSLSLGLKCSNSGRPNFQYARMMKVLELVIKLAKLSQCCRQLAIIGVNRGCGLTEDNVLCGFPENKRWIDAWCPKVVWKKRRTVGPVVSNRKVRQRAFVSITIWRVESIRWSKLTHVTPWRRRDSDF